METLAISVHLASNQTVQIEEIEANKLLIKNAHSIERAPSAPKQTMIVPLSDCLFGMNFFFCFKMLSFQSSRAGPSNSANIQLH